MLKTAHTEEEMLRTGVYKIKNTVNGKFYIGSTAASFRSRMEKHISCLNKKKHHSGRLQASWDKHGHENFEFSIVEFCDPGMCLEREQFFLDLLTPFCRSVGYNILPNSASSFGVKRSAEFREKCRSRMLGAKHSKSQIEKMSASLTGRKVSQETKDKISRSNSGKKRSQETIEKIRKSKIGFKKSPEAIEKSASFLRGKRKSPEAIAKSARNRTGLKRTESQIESIKNGTKAGRQRRLIFNLFVNGISSSI